MKIAIIFFGLTRSLEKTIDSFKKNLFGPLEDNSIDYDIFIHTYKIYGPYHNIWAKEHTENYKNENAKFQSTIKIYETDTINPTFEKILREEYELAKENEIIFKMPK